MYQLHYMTITCLVFKGYEKHNYYAIYLIVYMSLISQKKSRTQPYTVRTGGVARTHVCNQIIIMFFISFEYKT